MVLIQPAGEAALSLCVRAYGRRAQVCVTCRLASFKLLQASKHSLLHVSPF